MKIPNILTVTVLEEGTTLLLANLAVVLELFARRKNNYVIGPVISDSSGRVEFTLEECKRSIKADQEMFLMDYVDNIDDCETWIEVRLHLPAHIDSMIQQYKKSPLFWGKRFQNAAKFFQALEHVENAAFKPAFIRLNEVQALINPNVTLLVSREGS